MLGRRDGAVGSVGRLLRRAESLDARQEREVAEGAGQPLVLGRGRLEEARGAPLRRRRIAHLLFGKLVLLL